MAEPESVSETPAVTPPAARKEIKGTRVPARSESELAVRGSDQPAGPQNLALNIPAILLEGDFPSRPMPSGPGNRFDLGPGVPYQPAAAEPSELPESYGTGRMMLMARDPHWLYAHWDLTGEEQRRYNALAAGRHLVVRVRKAAAPYEPVAEIDLHPESSHWFIHVAQGGIAYMAELGYYAPTGGWTSIATSEPAETPGDGISDYKATEFVSVRTFPAASAAVGPARGGRSAVVPFATRYASEEAALPKDVKAQERDQFLETPPAPRQWTPAQEAALEEIVVSLTDQRRWISSEEVVQRAEEALRRGEAAAPSGLEVPAPFSPAVPFESVEVGIEAVSSPVKIEAARPRGFWFNINAELILYGATEPDARVELARRPVRLRPDGTFSARFALPDGDYEIDAMAISKDGDWRRAALQFRRRTDYQGEVGKHPQDSALTTMPIAQ